MLFELLTGKTSKLSQSEIEEQCRELEDAYAEALKDNEGFDVLNKIWKRIQELQRISNQH